MTGHTQLDAGAVGAFENIVRQRLRKDVSMYGSALGIWDVKELAALMFSTTKTSKGKKWAPTGEMATTLTVEMYSALLNSCYYNKYGNFSELTASTTKYLRIGEMNLSLLQQRNLLDWANAAAILNVVERENGNADAHSTTGGGEGCVFEKRMCRFYFTVLQRLVEPEKGGQAKVSGGTLSAYTDEQRILREHILSTELGVNFNTVSGGSQPGKNASLKRSLAEISSEPAVAEEEAAATKKKKLKTKYSAAVVEMGPLTIITDGDAAPNAATAPAIVSNTSSSSDSSNSTRRNSKVRPGAAAWTTELPSLSLPPLPVSTHEMTTRHHSQQDWSHLNSTATSPSSESRDVFRSGHPAAAAAAAAAKKSSHKKKVVGTVTARYLSSDSLVTATTPVKRRPAAVAAAAAMASKSNPAESVVDSRSAYAPSSLDSDDDGDKRARTLSEETGSCLDDVGGSGYHVSLPSLQLPAVSHDGMNDDYDDEIAGGGGSGGNTTNFRSHSALSLLSGGKIGNTNDSLETPIPFDRTGSLCGGQSCNSTFEPVSVVPTLLSTSSSSSFSCSGAEEGEYDSSSDDMLHHVLLQRALDQEEQYQRWGMQYAGLGGGIGMGMSQVDPIIIITPGHAAGDPNHFQPLVNFESKDAVAVPMVTTGEDECCLPPPTLSRHTSGTEWLANNVVTVLNRLSVPLLGDYSGSSDDGTNAGSELTKALLARDKAFNNAYNNTMGPNASPISRTLSETSRTPSPPAAQHTQDSMSSSSIEPKTVRALSADLVPMTREEFDVLFNEVVSTEQQQQQQQQQQLAAVSSSSTSSSEYNLRQHTPLQDDDPYVGGGYRGFSSSSNYQPPLRMATRGSAM
jgi:hypothetical protein